MNVYLAWLAHVRQLHGKGPPPLHSAGSGSSPWPGGGFKSDLAGEPQRTRGKKSNTGFLGLGPERGLLRLPPSLGVGPRRVLLRSGSQAFSPARPSRFCVSRLWPGHQIRLSTHSAPTIDRLLSKPSPLPQHRASGRQARWAPSSRGAAESTQ